MLSLQNKQINSIFERIVRDNNGVLVRIRFVVIDIGGRFQPQIISIESLISKPEKDVVCLPCLKERKSISEKPTFDYSTFISPYFSLEFFMSQPTRAPAFAI